ncbi:MAG: UvrD-helicase domain-containing protein [Sandaracinaceae bacterium]|jgi:superfamily I DNA/RNA helicase|nr:UvrD-helicase domain-containing protein [Sandaracinaceae bacterium]
MSLNPAQREAVEHDQGPMLVLAGAGSGKTRVITARIARLIERGTRPDAILGVTFTNKAAREMAERMVPLIGRERTERVWLSTFHSFGVRFLGEESKRLGFEGGRFVIFDQGDSLGLVKDILRTEVGITRNVDVPSLMTRISLWKNAFKGPDEIPASTFEYDAIAREVYPHYEDRMRRMHAVDFDDLVVLPVRILQQHEDVREKWRARFRYLLIDEFQDTNKSQLELVRALANSMNNVCVVGDDDQSIYGWRGAEVGNILDFERYFPGTKVVKLEDNYRSYAQILAVANAAIAQSRGKRHGKTLRAARGLGDKVRLVTTNDAANEVEFVVNEIHDLAQNHRVAYRDMAVLYRSNGQARILEEELRAGGIPYQLFGGTQFFDRKEVKDAIAYLRVVVSTRDELSIRRVINTPPRGLGDTSLDRIAGYGKLHGLSLFEALQRAEQVPGITEPAKRGAELFTQSIERARTSLLREGAELVPTTKRLFEDAGYTRMLSAGADKDSKRRVENFGFLMRSVERYASAPSAGKASLSVFLTRLTLRVDNEEEVAGNKVTLSSLHSSKGLEFPVVFFIGLVEGILPHSRTTDPKVNEAVLTDVDEERRLFYVGVTRAMNRLYLTRPLRRTNRGRVMPLSPTRFLSGLPEDAYEAYQGRGRERTSVQETADFAAQILAQLNAK